MCRFFLAFHLLRGHKASLREGIYDSLHFSEVAASSQLREAPGSLLSASIDSQLLLAQNGGK